MATNNTIYLSRRSKIVLPVQNDATLPLNYVVSVMKNLEALGFTFSEALMHASQRLSLEELTTLYRQMVMDLQKAKGAHRQFKPMYPNFPAQVMAMPDSDLYLNAIVHYWTGGQWTPRTPAEKRLALREDTALNVIDLGTEDDFESLFGQLASANASLSVQDKEDLAWFVATYGNAIERLLPASIPQKENLAYLASLLTRHTDQATGFAERYFKTAIDVLRLAVALSDGDVSLAGSTKFRTFTRPERRILLGLIDRRQNATEDMLRWKKRWIRLGEKLHPGEHRDAFPRAAAAFDVLRNDLPYPTFNADLEKALANGDADSAVSVLATRPGDFARRLDHLLRIDERRQDETIAAFVSAAGSVSTPVLLQLRKHFQARNDDAPLRVFFPKGDLAKAHAEVNRLPKLDAAACNRVESACEAALISRFQTLPPLGRCYLDPALMEYLIPFSARSASKSFRTIGRGSRVPLPENCRVLRFFVWWKNGTGRTDIDLSATMLDADFRYVSLIAYYNLKDLGGVHSGDIVDAPDGASEFIDLTLDRVRARGIRYIVMSLTSYTHQPYAELPECFAGWMSREDAGSGEIYDPRMVQDKLDITADTKIALPLIIDVIDKKVIWCDMALRSHPRWQNNVHGNLSSIALTVRSMIDLKKPSLHDLFALHVRARGQFVGSPELADTVFSVANGTPLRQEEVVSEYLA